MFFDAVLQVSSFFSFEDGGWLGSVPREAEVVPQAIPKIHTIALVYWRQHFQAVPKRKARQGFPARPIVDQRRFAGKIGRAA